MRRIALPTLVLVALLVTPAAATRTRTDTVTASVHKTGRSGTDLVYKGTVHSKVFGKGNVTEYVRSDLTGRFVITYKKGVVRGTSVAQLSKTGLNGIDVTGTYKLTSGTKRYKHISGKGTFTGHSDASLNNATFRQHGKVRY